MLHRALARQARADFARSNHPVLGRRCDPAVHCAQMGRKPSAPAPGSRRDFAGDCGRRYRDWRRISRTLCAATPIPVRAAARYRHGIFCRYPDFRDLDAAGLLPACPDRRSSRFFCRANECPAATPRPRAAIRGALHCGAKL